MRMLYHAHKRFWSRFSVDGRPNRSKKSCIFKFMRISAYGKTPFSNLFEIVWTHGDWFSRYYIIRRSISSLRRGFHLSVENNLELLWLLHDAVIGLKSRATCSTNHLRFPPLALVTCINFAPSLVHSLVYVCRDWPL